MAVAHSIQPFPESIDRVAFGHYVSGLSDGEGCFQLVWHTTTPIVRFSISLRDDDKDILYLIQSYWRCGKMFFYTTQSHVQSLTNLYAKNTKPRCDYCVRTIPELIHVVIPHFESFPLRAKKRHDYAIWKQGVLLAWRVYQRPVVNLPRSKNGCIRGTARRWTDDEKEHFFNLAHHLRAQRKYDAAKTESPDMPVRHRRREPSLFDGQE